MRSTYKIGQLVALTTSSLGLESLMQLDTHADTTVLGRHCLVVQDFNLPVGVPGWDSTLRTIECPTITGVVAYDHPTTGKTYMLVFNQAIYAEGVGVETT